VLRRKPNAEKRVAFVLTNSAAKASRIGNAVGLDAPASLLRLFAVMQQAGYRVEGVPETGDALLLFADARDVALPVAGKMRNLIGERCGLRDPKTFTFCWVLDFPYLEID